MKYIKIFEDILEPNYKEISEIEDIINTVFLELEDSGYRFKKEIKIGDYKTNFIILDLHHKEDFLYSEISDRINMFIDSIKLHFKYIDVRFSYYDFSVKTYQNNGDTFKNMFKDNKKNINDDTLINVLTIYIEIKKPNMIQRFIKKFEGFEMNKSKCDRCGEPTNSVTTMSIFNTDIICMDCKKLEKEDPDYDLACSIEREEIRKGNTNFKGAFPNYKPLK